MYQHKQSLLWDQSELKSWLLNARLTLASDWPSWKKVQHALLVCRTPPILLLHDFPFADGHLNAPRTSSCVLPERAPQPEMKQVHSLRIQMCRVRFLFSLPSRFTLWHRVSAERLLHRRDISMKQVAAWRRAVVVVSYKHNTMIWASVYTLIHVLVALLHRNH